MKKRIAANLALAIQQQASRTLLIDADLRHPVIHRSLQLPKDPGLTDALVGEATLEDCLRSSPSGLSVLTAGTTAPNPAELLGSDAFATLLSQLRERFDTVVIDTPPVLSVTDAATLAPVVDGMLVVAAVNQTHRLALAHAVEQLSMVKGAVLGVLLNRAPPTGAYRRYAYPYGAYSQTGDSPLGQLRQLLGRSRRSG